MNGVFISYVKENKKAVCEFYQDLKSNDINVWLDRNEIDPGARWKHAIRNAIREGPISLLVSLRSTMIEIKRT